MQIRKPSRITLRQLVLVLSIGSVLIMLLAGMAGAYRIQRDQLMDDTLAANQAFAEKLAASTSDLLKQAQQNLAYSADRIIQSKMDPAVLQSEADHLRAQGSSFNSVSVTNDQGVILAVAPSALNVRGRRISQTTPHSSPQDRSPSISSPFTSMLGNLAILITQPLFNAKGQYLGDLAGTVYLKSDGSLSRLIGRHYFRNDTYVYVVDATRRLLYHPQTNRIGTEVVYDNPAIDAVLTGESGALRITNSQGIDMLAGFAYVPGAKWGIVVQRPTQVTLARLDTLMHRTLWLSLVPVVLLLTLLWFLSGWVSRPLGELALIVRDGYEDSMARRIQSVRCWYFEAQRLQRALLESLGAVGAQLGQLHDEAYQDPLTGLGNRRGLALALQTSQALGQPFAVVALDIDFFKRINDTYGHDTGDQVIRQVGHWMRTQARDGDTLFRMGGEEFLALLPGAHQNVAINMAERLRSGIEQAAILSNETVTVSIGVAAWSPDDDTDTDQVLKAADQALYRAKQAGRNRVEGANAQTEETGAEEPQATES